MCTDTERPTKMKPIVEDEETGGLSEDVPVFPAGNGGRGLSRPSLRGLDREFSTRFGMMPPGGNSGGGGGGNQQQQQQQHAPNFADYLKA